MDESGSMAFLADDALMGALGLRVYIRWIIIIGVFIAAGWFMTGMSGSSSSASLLPLSDEEALISANLQQHVEVLSTDIGERNVWRYDALELAAEYIWNSLETLGIVILIALVGTGIWLLVDLGVIRADSTRAITWLALFAVGLILAVGLSWSHLWRRLSGQLEVDDDG